MGATRYIRWPVAQCGLFPKNNRWSITNVIANSQNLVFFCNAESWKTIQVVGLLRLNDLLQSCKQLVMNDLRRQIMNWPLRVGSKRKGGPTTLKSRLTSFVTQEFGDRQNCWQPMKVFFYEGQMITRLCVCCVATKTCPLIMCSLLPFVPVPQLRGQRWGFGGHGFQTVHPTR